MAVVFKTQPRNPNGRLNGLLSLLADTPQPPPPGARIAEPQPGGPGVLTQILRRRMGGGGSGITATPTGASAGDSRGHADIGPGGQRVYHTEGWWNVLNHRDVGQGTPQWDHPIQTGGPIDRYSAPGGAQSGGTGLAHAILVGNAKTRPVNPGNRSSSGGLYGLLASSAQRAMEQQAQMKGAFHAGSQGRMRALQQESANLHAGGVAAPY